MRFRSLLATLNDMSLDRSDVQYAAKETCTKMANPTRGSWKRLEKACKYLRRKVTWVRASKHNGVTVAVHVGSGRKSTCCLASIGEHVERCSQAKEDTVHC